MSDILNAIVEKLRADLPERRRAVPTAELSRRIAGLPPPPDFAAAVRNAGRPGIIAEIKRASPSQGLIRPDFRPLALALELEAAGAAALSVLTEPNYFLGRLNFLEEIAAVVRIPVLRKDFIFDAYQIYEARAAGAAAILLIAALLDDENIRHFTALAHELGLQVLGEAHHEEELARLLLSDVDLIGLNARDLHNFTTDLEAAARLLAKTPRNRTAVAESAIRSCGDLLKLRAAGAAGFLIGETLMRAESPGERLRELFGELK